MRPSNLFLAWALLASTAASLQRWQFDIETQVIRRQDTLTTEPATSNPAVTSTLASSVVQLTTSAAVSTLISDSGAASTSLPTTSQQSLSSTSAPPPTPTSDPTSTSVGLLFTQTQPTSRAVVTVTVAPSSDHGDSNVAFVDSKYHQLIIALASISGALLIALIATAVIAFRARADNDLLHDQISRYEEGISLQHRGKGSSIGSVGGYGRLSLNDPDGTRRSRRSLSEGQLKPMAGSRLSGTPLGSELPVDNRHVTFGSEESHSNAHSGTNQSPLLSAATSRDIQPFGPRPLVKTGSSEGAVRRLPPTPKASSGSHEGYTDPFTSDVHPKNYS